MIKKILEKNAELVCRHPLLILVLSCAVTVLLLIPALGLKGSFNILKLLPEHSEDVVNLKELLREFGGEDRLLIALEARNEKEKQHIEKYADSLLRTVKREDEQNSDPFFKNIETLSEDERQWIFRYLYDNGIYFLDAESARKTAQRLSPGEIEEAVKKDALLIRSGSPLSRERVKNDPLDLSSVFMEAFPSEFIHTSQSFYRSSGDGTLCIIRLQPVKLPQDGAFSTKLLRFCRKCAELTEHEFSGPVPRVSFAGGYALAASDTDRILGVIFKTFIVSLIIVSLMLYIGFKEIMILFIIVPSLGIAICWTAGFAGILFGEITVVTAAFAAVLLGLGVDFAIHIYNRFRIELSLDRPSEEAMKTTHTQTGYGILMGAFTTSAAFYILALSDFSGMREFGILVGTGVLLSALLYFTAFSALLHLIGKRGFRNTYTRTFGLSRLYRLLLKPHPLGVFCLFMVIGIGGAVYVFQGESLGFESDPRELRPYNDPVMAGNRRFSRRMGRSLVQFPVVVKAGSFTDLLDKTAELCAKLETLTEQGTIKSYTSPGQFLKTVPEQKRNLEILASVDFAAAADTLRTALKKNRFRPDAFEATFSYLRRLQRKVSSRETLDPEQLDKPPLNRFTSSFLNMHPEQNRFLSLSVFHTEPGKERSFDIDAVTSAVEQGDSSVFVSGVNVISRVVVAKISWWFTRILPAVFGVIMLLLFINFRSVKYSVMAAGPLCIGISLLWATMKVCDIRFNVMNFGIIPLVIGMGVDNGIHIIRGYIDAPHGSDRVRESISVTGRAVVMTSLTTVAGFGSLIIGEYRGIISMGVIASLGIGYCLIATLVFLPVTLLVFEKKNDDAERGQP